MARYVIKRILSMIPSLILTSILVFLFVHMIPGDPAITMLGDTATEEQLEVLREEMGLKEPLTTQYMIWMAKVVRGNLGDSIFQNRPVMECIIESSETSLLLGVIAMVLILLISLPVGILSATKANSWVDQSISAIAMFFAAVPAFWLGLNLMLLFAVKLMWLPSSGFPSIVSSGDWSNLRYLILPSVAIAIPNTALIVRMTRSSNPAVNSSAESSVMVAFSSADSTFKSFSSTCSGSLISLLTTSSLLSITTRIKLPAPA